MDFESEHDVAFDFGGFFRDRVRRSLGHGSKGSVGSLNSMEGRGYGQDVKGVVVAEMGHGVSQGQHQQAVAELDGGAPPLYRGIVGVGR